MSKRPNKATLVTVIAWLNDQGITLYTGNANLETGQKDFGCMDVDTAEQAIAIYNLNKKDAWIDPIY